MKSQDLQMVKPSLRKRQKRRDKRMHEELIECYRKGGHIKEDRPGYQTLNRKDDFKWARNKEGMKFMIIDPKDQCDNLGPLIRFLESKKGKFWDKVYSELCEKMDKKSVTGQHLFDHLMEFVYTDAYIVNGKVYSMKFRAGQCELISYWYPKYYVHPKSGVLIRVKRKEKYYKHC